MAFPERRTECRKRINKEANGSLKKLSMLLLCLASLLLALPACAQEVEPSVLIAYFTWAENTVIEDEEASLDSCTGAL